MDENVKVSDIDIEKPKVKPGKIKTEIKRRTPVAASATTVVVTSISKEPKEIKKLVSQQQDDTNTTNEVLVDLSKISKKKAPSAVGNKKDEIVKK